jgi:hypothetical protein
MLAFEHAVTVEHIRRPFADPGARWYVAATAPRLERAAELQCWRVGVPTFLPLRELAANDPKAFAPLWPGYLFVAAAAVPRGVTAARRMVATENGPVATPRGMVERLIERADRDGIVLQYKPAPGFKAGDMVRIEFGPFTGAFGTIVRVDGHYARVELNLFARIAPVSLKTEQLTRIPDPA